MPIPKTSREEILGRTGLFDSVAGTSLKALAGICRERDLGRKAMVFFEGEAGESIYILVAGSIRLYKTGPDGRDVVIKVVRPGEMFGEVILFEQERYPVSAVALRDSRVYVVPRREFSKLLADERFRDDFVASLMGKLRYLADQIRYLTSHDVEDRLFAFLEGQFGRKREIVPKMSKKDVASSIAATPETLSRLLQRLKAEGRLSWDGARIVVNDNAWPDLAG